MVRSDESSTHGHWEAAGLLVDRDDFGVDAGDGEVFVELVPEAGVGSFRAVIDWSNSMLGDPASGLARVAEYARLPENGPDYADFVHGYTSVRSVPHCSAERWARYAQPG